MNRLFNSVNAWRMYESTVRKKLMFYLEETKMSKYRFAQESGMSLSTLYDIVKKEDHDIRESNIIKVGHGMKMEPFELFQTNKQILVIQNLQEITLIQEVMLLPLQYQKILFEYLQSLRKIAENKDL